MMEENTRQTESAVPCEGIVYCIGVGPGDPELITLKAVRLIRACDVIAVPGSHPQDSIAYRIVAESVPEIVEKRTLAIEMPMTKDRDKLEKAHRQGAEQLMMEVRAGLTVGYLILGDPSIYGSFTYLHKILKQEGCDVRFCSGVPSFCAAAARLGISLTEGEETLEIVPGMYCPDTQKSLQNTVIMKAGPRIDQIRAGLEERDAEVYFAENCGMIGERIARTVEEIPKNAGYFSTVIMKGAESCKGEDKR